MHVPSMVKISGLKHTEIEINFKLGFKGLTVIIVANPAYF